MPYPFFDNYKEAEAKEFLNPQRLTELWVAQNYAHVSDDREKGKIRSNAQGFFRHVARALLIRRLNARPGQKSIILGSVRPPAPVSACAWLVDGGQIGEPLNTVEALPSIAAHAARLESWKNSGALPSRTMAMNDFKLMRLERSLVLAYLDDENLVTGHNPRDGFFMSPEGHLQTTLSFREVDQLTNALNAADFGRFRSFSAKGYPFGAAYLPVRSALHMREKGARIISTHDVELDVKWLKYTYNEFARPALHYSPGSPQAEEHIRAIYNIRLHPDIPKNQRKWLHARKVERPKKPRPKKPAGGEDLKPAPE